MKDTPSRIVFPGFVVPGLLSLLVIINLINGSVYVPRKHGGLEVYTDVWRVAGAILFKISVSAALFAWYVVANDERVEHLAQPALAIALVGVILGTAAFFYGFF